mmetsp:Transcript_52728/g.123313  ORF Transcript_52728/g.123313 Transcript_52728/m.123313 type:complete len:137 (+) Transcript_52728:141-551(+)
MDSLCVHIPSPGSSQTCATLENRCSARLTVAKALAELKANCLLPFGKQLELRASISASSRSNKPTLHIVLACGNLGDCSIDATFDCSTPCVSAVASHTTTNEASYPTHCCASGKPAAAADGKANRNGQAKGEDGRH